MGTLIFILIVAAAAWFMNQLLIRKIDPRRSFLRLIIYILAGFAMAFLYTFIFAWFLLKYL